MLKNIDYVVGVVCYTGKDTKVMMNTVKSKTKKSDLQVKMGWQILTVFAMLVGLLSSGVLLHHLCCAVYPLVQGEPVQSELHHFRRRFEPFAGVRDQNGELGSDIRVICV